MESFRKWEQILQDYYDKYKYNFTVQKIKEFPYPWLNYKTPEYDAFVKKEGYVSQREVFYDEVVFDIDMDKDLSYEDAKKEAIEIAKILSQRLKDLDYSHTVWDSGGMGVHIHLFLPELLKLTNIENRIMKRTILKTVGQGFIRPRTHRGKVQLQHLPTIQLEESLHRKGRKKKLLWEYKDGINILSSFFYQELREEQKRNDILRKHFEKKKKDEKPNGIVLLESENFYNFKDGRDRALFILTGYYKQFVQGEELFNVLKEWNIKVLKGYFDDKVIRAKMKSCRPGIAYNYLVELLDELGVDQKYVIEK